jgi:hypothetical protein
MLKSLRVPCRRTCTTLERWGEWREEGEPNIKDSKFNSKSISLPNWLRIFHVTDEKDRVCARET